MPRKSARQKRKSRPKKYDDFDFYDDEVLLGTNNTLYKDKSDIERTCTPAKRSIFVVYPKDIEMIFGFKPELAMQFLFEIRKEVAILKNGFVSPEYFCKYTGIDEQTLKDFMEES